MIRFRIFKYQIETELMKIMPASISKSYQLDNFIVCEGNKTAFEQCQKLIESNSNKNDPLLLYGKPGLGKTHLISAVGNYIADESPKIKVQYWPNHALTAHFPVPNALDELRAVMLKAQVLLFDDIQYFSGRYFLQSYLFSTINKAIDQNIKVIMTADILPWEIPGIDPEFDGRFNWGIICEIQVPESEGLELIVRRKLESAGLCLSEAELQTVVELVDSDVRSIEGAVNRLQALQNSRRNKIDTDLIRKSLLYLPLTD